MSKKEKLLSRFLSLPKDFTYDELKSILAYFGFVEMNRGVTSGSAVKFYCKEEQLTLKFHKPHPGNIVKKYVLQDILDRLKKEGFL